MMMDENKVTSVEDGWWDSGGWRVGQWRMEGGTVADGGWLAADGLQSSFGDEIDKSSYPFAQMMLRKARAEMAHRCQT